MRITYKRRSKSRNDIKRKIQKEIKMVGFCFGRRKIY